MSENYKYELGASIIGATVFFFVSVFLLVKFLMEDHIELSDFRLVIFAVCAGICLILTGNIIRIVRYNKKRKRMSQHKRYYDYRD